LRMTAAAERPRRAVRGRRLRGLSLGLWVAGVAWLCGCLGAARAEPTATASFATAVATVATKTEVSIRLGVQVAGGALYHGVVDLRT
jgi:hypothetical protein